MIIRLATDTPPSLTDLDRFDRLHASCDGSLDAMAPGPLCRWDTDDPEHVWLDIAEARAIGARTGDETWASSFEAMIAYASSKGWLDADRTHVRAHVELL